MWNALPRLPFLLPHDKSYMGFRHLADQDRGLFLDVGANNGITAAGFRRLNRTYDILSIEASILHEPSLERLRRTMPRFQYRRVGAGATRGRLTLYTPIYRGVPIHTHTSASKEYLGVSLNRDFSPRVVARITYHEQVVEIVPLDELELAPSIVKIDVEGADYQILLGLRATIERYRPHILVEFTPRHMGDFEQFFEQRKYSLFVYDERADTFTPFRKDRETETWQTTALQVNVFCVPSERTSILPLSGPGNRRTSAV
jgi:FkbM family methyltransferase